MARDVWQKFITSRTDGRALDGAQITVNVQGGGLATIWNARSGGSQLPNPFNTGADGLARFFADPGFYEVTAFKAGEGTATFVWNNLGDNNLREDVGTMAFVDAQTSTTDTTAGRGLIVGAFGLGQNSAAIAPTGFYYSTSAADPFRILSIASPVAIFNTPTRQFGISARGTQVAVKTYGESSDPTMNLYHNRNILGTVSQSGGVPTGAIIQRGSNANGEFVRFADGTLICTRVDAVDLSISATTATEFNYPSSFVSPPSVSVGSAAGRGDANNLSAFRNMFVASVSSDTRWAFYSDGSGSAVGAQICLTAIGRWF